MSYVAIWHVTRFICQSLNTETLGQYLCTGISHWCIAGQSLHDTCRCSYQRCWYISWTGDTLLFQLHIHPHLHKKKEIQYQIENMEVFIYIFIFTVGHTHYAFKITQNKWLRDEKIQPKKIFVLKYSKAFSSLRFVFLLLICRKAHSEFCSVSRIQLTFSLFKDIFYASLDHLCRHVAINI